MGAILTCPLEVVKTRLQSSSITFYISSVHLSAVNGASVTRVAAPGPLHCLKYGCLINIVQRPSVSFKYNHTCFCFGIWGRIVIAYFYKLVVHST